MFTVNVLFFTHTRTHVSCSRDQKVIHCRIHTKTDEGAAHIKYYTEREVMFESIYDLIQYYQVHPSVFSLQPQCLHCWFNFDVERESIDVVTNHAHPLCLSLWLGEPCVYMLVNDCKSS